VEIRQSYLTRNPCYRAGRKIKVKGLMLHSVGCPQPSASVFIRNWNSESYNRACVHGFIDANDGVVYQTLPWDHRGWHGGGSSNNTHIGVEMCEPACIRYTTGANFTCSDRADAVAAVERTYRAAVELFAMLCEQFGLDPLADGVIVSHREGHARGIASNHGDPEHLWRGLDLPYTMDTFRQAVYERMTGKEDDDMDVTRFKELWTQMREELQDNDAGEYSKEARQWAVDNGIIHGGDTTQFNGMWQDMLTREQMVTVLYRFAQVIGKV